jgi:hypothetical protein
VDAVRAHPEAVGRDQRRVALASLRRQGRSEEPLRPALASVPGTRISSPTPGFSCATQLASVGSRRKRIGYREGHVVGRVSAQDA